MSNSYIDTPIGLLEIICDDEYLLEIKTVNKKTKENINDICLKVKEELVAYFFNNKKMFDIKIKFTGTSFQNKVWNELLNVPFGEVISYMELANRVGNPKGVRAVANAVGANKLLIIVPCHRIIGSNNTLTGFSSGIENKIKLLNHENHQLLIKENIKKSMILLNETRI